MSRDLDVIRLAAVGVSPMDRHLDARVDAALADTFPASDPPFFMGGMAVPGSPHSKLPSLPTVAGKRVRAESRQARSGKEKKRR